MGKESSCDRRGGRCHAIVDALSRSPQVEKNLLGSRQRGNRATGGMRADSRIGHRLSLLAFAREKEIDLTVVGPEGPLPQDRGPVP